MRELSLDHLRTLVTAVDLGSLAAAARALHIAPPTVTVHIAELERRLGVRLLLRGGGRAAPTSIGQRFVERARRLLADADFAVEEVRDAHAGRGGEVRLGASTSVLVHLLPAVLEALQQLAPAVKLRPVILTSRESVMRVAAASIDIAVVALPQDALPGVRIQRWRRDPVQGLVPARWKPPARLTAKWLSGKSLILNDASTSLFRQTAEWFAAAGVHCKAHIETNYADAARNLVAASYGAALLPQEAAGATQDPRNVRGGQHRVSMLVHSFARSALLCGESSASSRARAKTRGPFSSCSRRSQGQLDPERPPHCNEGRPSTQENHVLPGGPTS